MEFATSRAVSYIYILTVVDNPAALPRHPGSTTYGISAPVPTWELQAAHGFGGTQQAQGAAAVGPNGDVGTGAYEPVGASIGFVHHAPPPRPFCLRTRLHGSTELYAPQVNWEGVEGATGYKLHVKEFGGGGENQEPWSQE